MGLCGNLAIFFIASVCILIFKVIPFAIHNCLSKVWLFASCMSYSMSAEEVIVKKIDHSL